GYNKDFFIGLPVPVSAITVASFTLTAWNETTGLDPAGAMLLPWMAAVLSLLMVSKVKYDTLPNISRRAVRKEPWKFVFFGLAVVVVFVTAGDAIFPLFLLFIALGIVRYLVGVVKRLLHTGEKYDEDESVEPTRVDT
ncbi:MAG: hypothetical protein WBG80_07270, partial [Bacteroidota bacterium]